MKHLIYILLFLSNLFPLCKLYAQDKILLLTGKEISGKVLTETEYELKYEYLRKKELREQLIEKYRVFSYTRNGEEVVVYKQDSGMGNYLTEEDMKYFIYGERDADLGYKPTASVIGGVIVGGAAGAYMGYDGGIILIATPFVYTAFQLLPKIKVNTNKISNKGYLIKENYLYGYERVARSRKVQRSLLSSVIGFGLGFAVSSVIVNNQ